MIVIQASAVVTIGKGLKSTENSAKNGIASTNADKNLDLTPNAVTSHSNEVTSVTDEKESLEVTGDVDQKPLDQDTAFVSDCDAVEQMVTTITSNDSKPVEKLVTDTKNSTNDDSTFPTIEKKTVMIVEVAADSAVDQQEKVAMCNKSKKKFIDIGIQVDLPVTDNSVHIDGNKATSDPTVTALLDELSSLK